MAANLDALESRINTVETKINILNGDSTTVDSVNYKIAAAVTELNTAINTKANQSDLNVLSGTVAENKSNIETRVGTVEANVSNNAKDIEALEGLVGTESVATQISTAAA